MKHEWLVRKRDYTTTLNSALQVYKGFVQNILSYNGGSQSLTSFLFISIFTENQNKRSAYGTNNSPVKMLRIEQEGRMFQTRNLDSTEHYEKPSQY
jgi:hypothetical protein